MKAKVWFGSVIGGTLLVLAAFAGYIITVDPFFHYHKPLSGIAYTLDNSRYQNDGIVKNFAYDTLITGTSMISNFKTTECDTLFGGTSIKTPFHGGSFREVNDHLEAAVSANPKLRMVIRCLDQGNFTQDKDYISYEGIPYYLYDKNPFNDTEYVWNKTVFMLTDDILVDTGDGKTMTTFDEDMNWQGDYKFGKEAVLATYTRPEQSTYDGMLSEGEKERTLANIRQNVTDVARENPDITFYYYFPPYSVCYWDVSVMRPGKLDWYIELQALVIEEILTCDNILLFSYDDNTDLTCNLDYYQDQIHYSEEINSRILHWMKEGKGRLTKENYEAYLKRLHDFYGAYDYDSIYK